MLNEYFHLPIYWRVKIFKELSFIYFLFHLPIYINRNYPPGGFSWNFFYRFLTIISLKTLNVIKRNVSLKLTRSFYWHVSFYLHENWRALPWNKFHIPSVWTGPLSWSLIKKTKRCWRLLYEVDFISFLKTSKFRREND